MREKQLLHLAKIITCCYVQNLKHAASDKERAKAQLLPPGHKDVEKRINIYDSLTLKHSALRMISNFGGIARFKLPSQDIDQAYIKSKETLQRTICVKQLKKLNLGAESLWKLLKSL